MMLRKAETKDAEAIFEIEALSIKRPWTLSLIRHDLESNPNALYFAAEKDGRLAGFIGIHDIVGEINITNIAVHPDFRRQGIADLLMESLLAEIKDRIENGDEIVGITLEVRKSNAPAIALYNKYGFKEEGIRKAYYSDGEDAIIMWRRYGA